MDWQKTVLKPEQITDIVLRHYNSLPLKNVLFLFIRMGDNFQVAETQAKASYEAGIIQGKMDYLLGQSEVIIEAKEAGKAEGIKTVVEWVINHYDNGLFLDEWKAKCKEWGIK